LKDTKKIALISVSDKSKLEIISNYLIENNFEIISTGGSLKKLLDLNIPAKSVEDITNFPEIMDGRVKTLHPSIHAGLLARKNDDDILKKLKLERINVLVVNFYPFEKVIKSEESTFNEAIENIDIGGPAMVRAAAKNYENCCVLTNPESYIDFTKNFNPNLKSNETFNKMMSLKAFEYVANYDISIANYLGQKINNEPFRKFHSFTKISNLRYGENPHQEASLYQDSNKRRLGIINSKIYQGKELSYNNIVDGDAALLCVSSFIDPTCVIVKHANPCGVASSDNLLNSYSKAFESDPTSAFGGVIAFNKEVDQNIAEKILNNQFVEMIIAPSFTSESRNILSSKKNIRVIQYSNYDVLLDERNEHIKSICDGILIQHADDVFSDNIIHKIVSKKEPSKSEFIDLKFSWLVSKYVKSNAIVFSKNMQTLGIGAGQMSRIDSTFIAVEKAKSQGFDLSGSVMASDAFFPFSDNVEKAAENGITAIIQPGGSQNDEEVISKVDELNLSMIFTGQRHFRH
tara:strand:- start:4216 stop:5766 length:1551 start_codon:yes stop_codon:yes gene_type:complete